MPPLDVGSTTPLGWFVLTGLGLGLIWALIAVPSLRWVAAAIVSWIIVSNWVYTCWLRKLASTRTDDIGTFARSLDFRNTDTWLIRSVYEEVNEWMPKNVRPFPLRTTDTSETLRIDPEEFEDLAGSAAERAGYSLEKLEDNPYFGSSAGMHDGERERCGNSGRARGLDTES